MAERVLSVRLRAIVDGYEKAMGRAAAATDKVAQSGSNMVDVGRKVSTNFSAPIAAAGTFALKSATSFESAFAGVEKTVDGTTAQMAMLRQGIIDMANSIPATREEIAGVAEAAGQLGIQTDQILGFTRVMVDLGNSTDVAAQDAAMSLAQLANITKMPQSEFDRLGASVVDLGNNFATTESRIIDMAQRIASAGTQIGLSESEILGFATALSSVGIEAEAGGSAISRVMIEVAKAVSAGGDELEKWATVAGMTSEQFAQLFREDAAAGISAVVQGLGNLSMTGQDLFGVMEELGLTDIRVGNAMRSLAGNSDLLDRTLRTASDAWEQNTALTIEAEKRYQTMESRLKVAASGVTDLARQAGEMLYPALNLALDVIGPVTDGLGTFLTVAASLPAPVHAAAGSILAIGAAAGPTIWGLGKLAGLYAPVVGGLTRMTKAVRSFAETLILTRMLGQSVTAQLWSMIGPQAAVAAGALAVAGAVYLAARRSEDFASRHRSAADAALALADAANIATQELRSLREEEDGEGPVISDEDFRRKNEDTLKTLREIGDLAGQQAMLMEIAFALRIRGVPPEQVVEQVERLAGMAGIEIPVTLTVEGIEDFDFQVKAAAERARRALEAIGDEPSGGGLFGGLIGAGLPDKARAELRNIANAAADAWATDNIEGFIRILAEAETALGDNATAINFLMDEAAKMTGLDDLNLGNIEDLESLVTDLAGAYSSATEPQKQMLEAILAAAAGMDQQSSAAALAAAAAEEGSWSLEAYDKAAQDAEESSSGLTGATDALAGGLGDGASAAEDLAAAIERAGARASLASLDFDAAAAAAQAYVDAVERSTRIDDQLGAGLRAGRALRELHEGMTGEGRIAEIHRDAAKEARRQADETEKAARAVDRIGDAVRRADPKLSGLQFRLDTLAAAAGGFRDQIARSSSFDNEITSALDLGEAFRNFEKTYRRLPATLDLGAVAMGRIRPRTAEAIRNMLTLGRAVTDYLGTLIEMGRTEDQVRAEAARLRGEYAAMFTQMGLNEEQVRRYLEAMGLLPEQIDTAITVSGLEAARFQLSTYLQLLEGRIPDHIATQVIADMDAGNVQAAADRLAAWARTNPPRIDVEVGSKGIDEANDRLRRTRDRIEDVKSSLWDLPDRFDPLTAALGGYTDAQMAALEAVMAFGDGVTEYLSKVADPTNVDDVRSQAYAIRDAFLEHIGLGEDVGKAYEDMSERAKSYLELIGLSDWQIESAITLSGDAEAMFRIQAYAAFLGEKIDPEVAQRVLALIDEGKLKEAADTLAFFRALQENNPIEIPVRTMLDTRQAMGGRDGALWFHAEQAAKRGIKGRARGGLVTGPGTETSDSIPTLLSNREYVLQASAVRSIGVPALDHMNRTGTIPGTTISLAAPLAPSPSFSDQRIVAELALLRSALENFEGQTNVDMNLYGDHRPLTPRRVAEAVGTARFLARGR